MPELARKVGSASSEPCRWGPYGTPLTVEVSIMSRRHLVAVSLLFCVLLPNASWSDPPAHAPAHGHRAKHGDHGRVFHSGVEVVFDSERGVHIAVGFPGLFFHEDQF